MCEYAKFILIYMENSKTAVAYVIQMIRVCAERSNMFSASFQLSLTDSLLINSHWSLWSFNLSENISTSEKFNVYKYKKV